MTGLLTVGGVLTAPAPAEAAQLDSPASASALAGRRLIKVTWTAPPSGTVGRYRATAGTESCNLVGPTFPGPLTCTINNLAANASYAAEVIACPSTNLNDTTDCSNARVANTAKTGPPAAPPAPTVTYTSADQTSMHLSWTANDEGAGIASYRVTQSPAFTSETGTCTVLVVPSGSPGCDVAGLTPAQSYSFRLTAIGINNETGSTGSSPVGLASVPKYVGLPAAPTAPTATRDSNTAVTVSWTKPSGGAAISGFTVQKTTGGVSTDVCTPTADATECQVTGLDPALTYTFKLRTNGEGTYGGSSAYSSNSSAIAPGKPNTPDAPTVELGAVAGKVRVYWTEPEAGGGTVAGYVVTPYSIVDQTPPSPCDAGHTARYCDFSGLDDGVAYTFKVVAKGELNAVNSDASGPSDSITSQLPAKPNTPTPALVTNTVGAVRLTWTPQNTGGPVIFYTVTAIPTPGAAAVGSQSSDCGFNLTTPSCTITGLDPTASYTFKVTAVGDLGFVESDASGSIVPNKPGAPTSASVALDDATTATVTWAAPAGGSGGVVANYTVTATAADASTVPSPCTKAAGDMLSCTFSGLNAAKSYSFKVTASNVAGTSTEVTAPVRAQDVPGAPQSVAAVLRNNTPGTVDVNWSAGTGTASRYVVTAVSTDGGGPVTPCTDSAPPLTCAFASLNTAKHYTFTVRAENILAGTAASPITGVVPDKPAAPDAVTATVTTEGEVTVTWDPPTSGGAVATYTAAVTDEDDNTSPICGAVPSTTETCDFTGLDSTKPYVFTVTATNAAGHTDATTDAIYPAGAGAPTITSVVLGNGPGKATVTWTAPTGAPVATYTVTATSADGGTTRTCNPATGQLMCTVTNLTTTSSYTFAVNAANPAGNTNSPSAPGSPIIPDEPGAPTISSAVRGNLPGKATVNWNAPGSGGEVASYTVTATPSDGSPPVVECDAVSAATRTCAFTTLTATKTYTFTVRADNAAGDGAATTNTGLIPNKPDKPTGVSISVSTPGSATVTWGSPAGAEVTGGWTVSVTSTNGGAPVADCIVNQGGTRSCSFTGLTTTATYNVVVKATNTAGETPSDTAGPIVANNPTTPGIPTAEVLEGTRVRLTWTESPAGGGPVAKYTAKAYTAGAPNTGIDSAACTNVTVLTCDFDGLSATETYTFRVIAIGPGGGSAQGGRSTPVTTAGPAKPAIPTVALEGSNAVRVTWTAPASLGPITSYSVTSTPDVSSPARCTNVNVVTCVFDRLTAGTEYTFKVAANGTAGRSTESDASLTILVPAVVTKPDAPGVLAVEVIAADKVRLTWTAPTGGGPVTKYTAKAYTVGAPNTGIDSAACTNVTGLTCEFGILSEMETYTFRVTATGAGGDTQSDRSKPVTTALPGKPAVPTVALEGANAVRVTWTAPGGGPVTSYSVTSTPDVSAPARCTNVRPPAMSCVFDRLRSGTEYTFKVVANGSADRSTSSDASNAIVAGPPAEMAAPTVSAAGATSVTVTWTTPTTGGVITGYEVRSEPSSAGCTATGKTATSCVVSGLTTTTRYTFQVKAVGATGGGDSVWSPASAGIMPGAPAAPTDVVVAGGDRQIAVSWTPPADTSNVTGYRAVTSPGGVFCETITNTDTECVITGLTNLTFYTVTVTAVGNDVSSPASAPSARVRPTAGAPGSPTAVTAIVNADQAVVSWTAPTSVGNGVARYVVTAVDTAGNRLTCSTPNSTTTSCPLTGLSVGTHAVTVVSVGRSASGYSEPSAAYSLVIKAAPGAPTNVTVTNTIAVKSLKVDWKAGTAGDGVAGFTATATPASGSGTTCTTTGSVAMGGAGTCTISSLTPGPYTVTVVARGTTGVPNSAASTGVQTTALAGLTPSGGTSVPTGSPATLTVSTATPQTGSTITVGGSGFAAYTTIKLVIIGSTTSLATVVTDASGGFSGQSVTIPSGTGVKTLAAIGLPPSGGTTLRYQTAALTVAAG